MHGPTLPIQEVKHSANSLRAAAFLSLGSA